jgi:hypothetical protein
MQIRAKLKQYARSAVLTAAVVGPVVLAQTGTSEPDPTNGVAEVAGAAALMITIANAKYVVQGLKWAAGKIGSMFGR